MHDLSDAVGFAEVALSIVLVGVGMAVSRLRKVGLEGDIGVALLRSFVQLLAVGYVLEFVFEGHGGLTLIVLAAMVATAAFTSGRRARRVPSAALVAGAAVAVATAGTLGILTALGIVPVQARAMVPLGSMVISNAMVTTSLVMTSLYDGLADDRREVEARLSLGETGREAANPWVRRALRTGMLPIVDNTKVVGLVALPGAMTGMILAGASPLAAIRLQLVVMYLILGGNAFAALVAGELAVRRLFTPAHQLLRSVRRTA
ncbi:MAG TPA: iron export ABC transporter permease subunit FetB [Acidimicrobiales bacterium]|nr:iron export ABC transporter permease subunit FetB [Acidimicrobiales bacterium]